MDMKIHHSPPAQVKLLGTSSEHTRILATVTRGYAQVYDDAITEREITEFTDDLAKTKLQTPNAFINFVWLLKNVTRNFEQQLTRYRVGTSFVCESLRFSDKRVAEFYCKAQTSAGQLIYERACQTALVAYADMLERKEQTQNARDVLPGSICTHLFFACNLQTLAHIYEQRRCCQAQAEEWTAVLEQMKATLYAQSPALASFLKAPWENPTQVTCGFGASFDRPCSKQSLFDHNLLTVAEQRRGEHAKEMRRELEKNKP